MSETPSNFGRQWDLLEAKLQARLRRQDLFGKRLIDQACADQLIGELGPELQALVKVRNLVKHNEHAPLVTPTLEAVSIVDRVLRALTLTCSDIAASPVYTVGPADLMTAVVETMSTSVYTAVPVIDDTRIIGVFSEATAVRLLATSAFSLSEARMSDLVEHLDQPNQSDKFSHYRCAQPDTPAGDISGWFGDSTSTGVRLNAVFVTEDGTPDSHLEGVITAWDLRTLARLPKT